MADGPVLVAGATGQLGRVIVRKLLEDGRAVRALSRSRQRLEALAASGAEPVVLDLRDLPGVTAACRGVSQIVSTANNNMGRGAGSPLRIDLTAHQNLCAAARNAGVGRITYVSFRGAAPDLPVDIFRLKWHIEDAIRRSGVPYVIMRPTAFLDIWVGEILAGGIRRNGVTPIFGDGTRVANYIAVEDVAAFAAAIVARPDIRNEIIEIGGPSDLSLNDLATLIERRLGARGRRKHIPVFVMRTFRPVIRIVNETVARMMSLGEYAATRGTPFPDWKVTADRFGIEPKTAEEYVAGYQREPARSTTA
jgi:uncharacterized protein YbjT (DUF2867 family)